MSLTQKEIAVEKQHKGFDSLNKKSKGVTVDVLHINDENPFQNHDYGIIIQAFESEAANWAEEDYALAFHYKDVYGTGRFSSRVRKQMDYYPGMHQRNKNINENPFGTEAEKNTKKTLKYWDNAMDNPNSFMNGLRSRQEDFDYGDIFGSDATAKERAAAFGKMVTECVPCFDEILDIDSLLPSGDLLEVHLLNIKIRTDILDKIKTLFKDPGAYIDICELLNLFSHICPRQLLAMIALLSQYLAKLNLDVKFNIDFIIQLVGPLLSPFLDGLSQWLDMWTQLILGPMICVIDNINESIMLAQNMKVPFSDIHGNVGADIGVALPGHKNISSEENIGAGATPYGENGRTAGSWGAFQWEQFNTPDSEKYNPERPVFPSEESQMATEEMREAWKPAFSPEEREDRDKRWEELRKEEQRKRFKVPPPLKRPDRDGRRWSKDDIPESEKKTYNASFHNGTYPPEAQPTPSGAMKYFDASPLVNSIVQLRNILQGAVQYVEDWFTYVTQMIYDLLGTEIGWMSKKADNTMLKSRIIQLIMMIRAIIKAISKNGLQCGIDSNFNPAQLKYILEEELNKNLSSPVAFEVQQDGTVKMTLPEGIPSTTGNDKNVPDSSDGKKIPGLTPDSSIPLEETKQEEPIDSSIIIKSCFKDIGEDDLAQVKDWIADFEKRGIV